MPNRDNRPARPSYLKRCRLNPKSHTIIKEAITPTNLAPISPPSQNTNPTAQNHNLNNPSIAHHVPQSSPRIRSLPPPHRHRPQSLLHRIRRRRLHGLPQLCHRCQRLRRARVRLHRRAEPISIRRWPRRRRGSGVRNLLQADCDDGSERAGGDGE